MEDPHLDTWPSRGHFQLHCKCIYFCAGSDLRQLPHPVNDCQSHLDCHFKAQNQGSDDNVMRKEFNETSDVLDFQRSQMRPS